MGPDGTSFIQSVPSLQKWAAGEAVSELTLARGTNGGNQPLRGTLIFVTPSQKADHETQTQALAAGVEGTTPLLELMALIPAHQFTTHLSTRPSIYLVNGHQLG